MQSLQLKCIMYRHLQAAILTFFQCSKTTQVHTLKALPTLFVLLQSHLQNPADPHHVLENVLLKISAQQLCDGIYLCPCAPLFRVSVAPPKHSLWDTLQSMVQHTTSHCILQPYTLFLFLWLLAEHTLHQILFPSKGPVLYCVKSS